MERTFLPWPFRMVNRCYTVRFPSISGILQPKIMSTIGPSRRRIRVRQSFKMIHFEIKPQHSLKLLLLQMQSISRNWFGNRQNLLDLVGQNPKQTVCTWWPITVCQAIFQANTWTMFCHPFPKMMMTMMMKKKNSRQEIWRCHPSKWMKLILNNILNVKSFICKIQFWPFLMRIKFKRHVWLLRSS